MQYFTFCDKLNGKLIEIAIFFTYPYLIYLARDIRKTRNYSLNMQILTRSFDVPLSFSRNERQSRWNRTPVPFFFSRGSLPSVVVRRGANFDSRFTYIQTFARHMGLSSSRKFDVLTVSGRGKEVEKNIYRVTLSHMARDKNAMLAVSQLARFCEKIMLGRNEMAHLMCHGRDKGGESG